MARVIVIGGGIVGLCGALLLGRDGHDVTVLERDPAPPPAPEAAWAEWSRRGVNQFRMLHFLQPRFHTLMEANAPDVVQSLVDAGGLRMNPFRDLHRLITGGFRDGDERFDSVTARRPLAEAVVARIVDASPNIDVRRGVTVTGLVAGDPRSPGIPHVVGVRTDSNEELFADLVVDAGGRRSTLPKLLTDIGAGRVLEVKQDCGFIYYARHFRSGDGTLPQMTGPVQMPYESISIVTLPADNGTWGVAVVTSAKDTALRRLRDVDAWTRVVSAYPLAAHWLAGDPLDAEIAVMAKIEDRERTFVIDGEPFATGVLALADAYACTNPSVGRGITMGTMHAVALRDLLRAVPDDPIEVARRWNTLTAETVQPWYRDTLAFDEGRLAQIDAEIHGREFEPGPEYAITLQLQAAASHDRDLLRGALDIAGVIATTQEVMARPGVPELVAEFGGGWREQRLPGLTREELLAVVNS